MWEHQCPVCRTFVEPTVIYCPKCLAPFNKEQWRVPPRFTKGRKAMSDYAHNILAPKLNPVDRALLFRYFTWLFNDGFETNDFTRWSGTSVAAGCSLTTEQLHVHHGRYNARAVTDGLINYENAAPFFTLPNRNDIYVRSYNKVLSHNINADGDRIFFTGINMVTAAGLLGGWKRTGGVIKWAITTRIAAAFVDTFSTGPLPAVNTWYCVELYWLYNAVNGIARMWVDGLLHCQKTGDTTNYGQCIGFGTGGVAQCAGFVACDVVADCCVAADSYIGVEPKLTAQVI